MWCWSRIFISWEQQEGHRELLLCTASVIVLGIICAAVFSYVFPLLAKFENTVKKTFENGARLAASHIGQTLVITVVNLFPVLWFLISPQTFSAIFWIWVFVGGGVQAFVNSLFLVKIFDRLAEA